MTWFKTTVMLPPENINVLVYGKNHGMIVAFYHHWKWEYTDYSKLKRSDEAHTRKIGENLELLNKLQKGDPEKWWWSCVCEDSSWPLEYFEYWAYLPEIPNAEGEIKD